MVKPEDLNGVGVDLARRLIARARSVAPCIDTLDDDAKQTAIAILRSAAAEVPAAGSRRTKSLSRNGTTIQIDTAGGLLTDDDVSSLRSLCSAAATPPGTPRGSFPDARPIGRLWPETKP